MRMKERGLSQGAMVVIIVGIVIAVVVPVTIVAVLLIGGGAPGGLPVYSGATEFKRTENDVAGGHLTSVYYDVGTANLADVYNWYKTEMSKQGWTLTADYTTPYYYLTYTKGSDSAEIIVVEGTVDSHSGKILVLAYTAGTATGTGGSIVGTWQGTHLGSTETFVFKSGGTYDWTSGGYQASGSWSMSGDVLSLDGYQYKAVIGASTMNWYEKDPDTGNWLTSASRSFTKVS